MVLSKTKKKSVAALALKRVLFLPFLFSFQSLAQGELALQLKSEVVLQELSLSSLDKVQRSQLVEPSSFSHASGVSVAGLLNMRVDLRSVQLNTNSSHSLSESSREPLEEFLVRGDELARLIRTRLYQSQNLEKSQLSIFAPQQIVLISARGQLRRQWINRIKAEYLKACSECQVEVELTQFPSDLDPQKVSLPTQALRWNQQFTIPLSSGALIGHSKILRAQFVLQAPVAQGERISESQLAKELRPFHPQARTLDLSRLPYSLARKALSMGAVITDVELMPEVLVRRGDLVKVVLGGAGFQVQIDAVSEGQGGFGDQVQVRNPQTRTLLSGTIYERGKVRVQ